MSNQYPTGLNNYATGASSAALAVAGHASAHNAYENKIGIGASTPVSNTVLRGTGVGTSAWQQIVLTTDITGTLPVANGGTGVTTSTGSGNTVLSTSPTLVTPILGVATATTVNKVTITTPATGSTLTIADGKTFTVNQTLTLTGVSGKTLTVNNSLTLAGTDSTTMTFPGSSDTVVTLAASQTLTNKTVTSPIHTVQLLSGTTPTINLANGDVITITMSGATTWSSPTNVVAGHVFMVESTQGSGTTYTHTWFSGITWVTGGGTAPVQTTTSSGITTYVFRALSSSTFLGYLGGTN